MLIVLRGNAASGKTTVARLLQERLDGPAALLSQDHFRRGIYAEREQDSLAHADLLEAAARHGQAPCGGVAVGSFVGVVRR